MTNMGDQVTGTSEVPVTSTKWKRYPEYKESGIEWLEEIPAHWDVRELKWLANITFSNVDKHKTEGEQSVFLCNYTDVYYNEYITDALDFMEATASPEETRRFMLKAGDVIITKDSESWDDIAVPAYVPVSFDNVLCGYHLAVIRPDQDLVDGEYLFRAFDSSGINDQFKVAATGITRYGLGHQSIKNALFPVPPLEEQRAIVGFLDRETARIDTLIAKKERLIALLQEKRAALISTAVTKGLNPNAPMKDSGVEWLGQVPAHWNISRVKFLAKSLQTGPFGSQLHSNEYVIGGTPVINPSHLVNGRIEPDWKISVDEETRERLKRHELQSGDIVFARRGDLGRCALVTEQEVGWLCGTGSLRMRPRKDLVHPPFLNWTLATDGVSEWLTLKSVGTTMDNLNTTILSELPLPVPPPEEQQAIVNRVAQEISKVDDLIGTVQQHNEMLQEYRTALISTAVTGKIDVRNAKPTLPEAP